MKNLMLLTAVAMILVLGACAAQPPKEKIEAAQKALKEAKDAGAETYAAESFKPMADKNTAMEAALTEKKYDEVEKLADEIKALSPTIVADAQKGKDKAKADAQAAVDAANTAVTAAEEALAKAPTGKGSAADLAAMKGDVDAAKKSVAEAQAAWDGGRYSDALTTANAAKQTADKVAADVQAAIDMKAGARK
ncbi:MAG: hypothetical protein KA419_07285 [Acidobacteria bacterium]|nr:hypothetical protein [Acidobacteriota bacterium]